MTDLSHAAALAAHLMASRDAPLWEIVRLSIAVSLSAVAIATIAGLPVGAFLALCRFPGRNALVVMFNAAMGLPPVVVGLLIYLLLSRSGPLGQYGLLFTPKAMVVAQALLVFPIVVALSRQVIEDLWAEYSEQLRSLGSGPLKSVGTLLWDGRFSLVTVVLAGFGRAAAEVGAIIIVGGNIDGYTRTMTTAIALETSKGDLALALALGFVLLTLVVLTNAAAWIVRHAGERYAGA
jgi:tungstate transport system permease protein